MSTQTALKLDPNVFDYRPYLKSESNIAPVFFSSLGALFGGDCLSVLPAINDEVVDTVFADPPFNLGKKYGDNCDDLRTDEDYLKWCKAWILESVRTLKPGGSFFSTIFPSGTYCSERISPNLAWSSDIGSRSRYQPAYRYQDGFIRATTVWFITAKADPTHFVASGHRFKYVGTADVRLRITAVIATR